MKLLTELLNLIESPEPQGPVDILDVVKYFPKNTAKAFKALLKNDRLQVKGKDFFDFLDDVLELAGQKALKKHEFELSLDVTIDDEPITGEVPADDAQEVYCGYSPSKNVFIVGFDVWINEGEFDELFERTFKRVRGQRFDYDNTDDRKIYDQAWKEFQTQVSRGYAVEVSINGKAGNFEASSVGGFYRSTVMSEIKSEFPDLIDLRLD